MTDLQQMTRTKNLKSVPHNYYTQKARQERSENLAHAVNILKFSIRQTLAACLQQLQERTKPI